MKAEQSNAPVEPWTTTSQPTWAASRPVDCYRYLRRRLASKEGIVTIGVMPSRCVCVRRAAMKVLHSAQSASSVIIEITVAIYYTL